MGIVWQDLPHNRIAEKTKEPYFSLRRAKVPGGWLVIFYKFEHQVCDADWSWGWGAGFGGMTFVPDPGHSWDGNSLA